MSFRYADAAVVLAILAVFFIVHSKKQSKSGSIRPPKAFHFWPWVGNALNYRNRAVQWLREAETGNGTIFRTTVLGKPVIFCLSRPVISQVFRNYTAFSFTPIRTDAHHRVFGVSKVAVSDEEGQKTMFAELYRVLSKKEFGPMVGHISENMESRFFQLINDMTPQEKLAGKSFALMKLIPPLFYGASAQGMFGSQFTADLIFKSNTDFEDQFGLMYTGLPFPWLVKRGVEGRDRCINMVKSYLAQYESGHASPPYFIQVMLGLRHTLGWTSQDLAAYLHSYLFALTSNTIYAAYWLVVYTYAHPEIIPELRAEVDAAERAFLQENPSETPSGLFSNLGFLDSQFPLLNSIINETLRLCSNGTSVREVMSDIVVQVPTQNGKVAGQKTQAMLFKQGDIIYMPNRFHHFSPEEFPDAEEFQPKRFMPEAKRQPGFFIPFGGGVSVCTGRFLASAELKAMMIILIRSFDAEAECLIDTEGNKLPSHGKHEVPPFDTASGSAILHPRGDMLLRLRPRSKN